MSTAIAIGIGTIELHGQLNDSLAAQALVALLPLRLQMSCWGDEYYGSLDRSLNVGNDPNAREDMEVGELAYWASGNALCLFFGPTPASVDQQPRAASPVSLVGTFSGDLNALRQLGRTVEVTVRSSDTAA
jgi:uncharacterized protein